MYNSAAYEIIEELGAITRDGLILFNQETREVIYVNESLSWILNVSPEAIIHNPALLIKNIIEEDLNYLNVQAEHLKHRQRIERTEIRISEGEVVRTLEVSAYKLNHEVLCYVRDISKTREHESYIIKYGAKKDALLEMLSHNLSGPLQISVNILASLEQALGQGQTTKYNEHINLMRQCLKECTNMVNEFLIDEHLTSEFIHTRVTRFDVVEKVNVLLEGMRPSYPDKQFTLHTASNQFFVNNDEVKFYQVVQNLLSNAVKFTRDNGKIDIYIKSDRDKFSVSVHDDGVGIPDPLKEYLFEKYSPAGRPGLKGEVSLGMGLYICRRLTALMGGSLTFSSRVQLGSAFTMELPLDKKGSP